MRTLATIVLSSFLLASSSQGERPKESETCGLNSSKKITIGIYNYELVSSKFEDRTGDSVKDRIDLYLLEQCWSDTSVPEAVTFLRKGCKGGGYNHPQLLGEYKTGCGWSGPIKPKNW